jgi:hypothetical protein
MAKGKSVARQIRAEIKKRAIDAAEIEREATEKQRRRQLRQQKADDEANQYWQQQQKRLAEREAREQHKKRVRESRKARNREAANKKQRDRIKRQHAIRNPSLPSHDPRLALGVKLSPLPTLLTKAPQYQIQGGYRVYDTPLGKQRIKTSDCLEMERHGLNVKAELEKAVEKAITDAHREQITQLLTEQPNQEQPQCESSVRTDCDTSLPPANLAAGPIGSTSPEV